MASLGHIVVGMTAARAYRANRPPRWPMAAAMTAWTALSLLPDADVIGFSLGVRYGDEWGHRGATHSIAFALVLATAIGLSARLFKLPGLRTGLVAAVVLVSHGLLDTMTDGGLGSALFWPFDLTRYFAPWQPIPVAPIGLDFVSPGGLMVSLVEAVLFGPFVWLALRGGRRPPALAMVAWCAAVFLVTWRGETRDNVLGYVMREDVQFAPAYSEQRFKTIHQGQPEAGVLALVGDPVSEGWLYFTEDAENVAAADVAKLNGCFSIVLQGGRVESAVPEAGCRTRGIDVGIARAEVRRVLGAPPQACWEYTGSPSGSAHRGRIVCFTQGIVRMTVARWMPPRH